MDIPSQQIGAVTVFFGDRNGKYPDGNQVVVTDWYAHKLSKPTWGAQWIQVGADYVLVEPLTHRIRAIKFYGC